MTAQIGPALDPGLMVSFAGAEAVLTNAAYAAAGRARLEEQMKLLFVTLHAGWQSAQKEGTLRSFSDSVAAMLATQTGNDLRALRLTDHGMVRQ